MVSIQWGAGVLTGANRNPGRRPPPPLRRRVPPIADAREQCRAMARARRTTRTGDQWIRRPTNLNRMRVMKRIMTLALLFLATSVAAKDSKPFSVVEATIPEMQAAMKAGRITSRDIVLQYLTRIAMYEDKINGVITVNPHALEEAEAL